MGELLKDWNDLHVAHGLEAVRAQLLPLLQAAPEPVEPAAPAPADGGGGEPPKGGWYDLLISGEKGPYPHLHNIYVVLTKHPAWQGVLAYDEFTGRVLKQKAPPYPGGCAGDWTDVDDLRLSIWLAEHAKMRVSPEAAAAGVQAAADDHRFHPVRDYLESLKWDGIPRLDGWLHSFLGVPASRYASIVGRKWLIAGVVRVYQPGTKADCVLILEGRQGAGKSTALKILGGDWFMDTPLLLGDKEAYVMIRGKWIVELGELDSFNKAESTTAKNFFSAPVDTYREAYGRRAQDVKRQCIFAGTTNQDHYLKDATGNRRYWPVRTGEMWPIALDDLRWARDQLWAEAVHRYKAGDAWWPSPDELPVIEAEQDARMIVDESWEVVIAEWLEGRATANKYPKHMEYGRINECLTVDILSHAIGVELQKQGRPEQTRIGTIMNKLGWVKHRPTRNGVRIWCYKRPDVEQGA